MAEIIAGVPYERCFVEIVGAMQRGESAKSRSVGFAAIDVRDYISRRDMDIDSSSFAQLRPTGVGELRGGLYGFRQAAEGSCLGPGSS